MVKAIEEHTATGRRKTAVAHVWLRPGTGKITINKRGYTEFFTSIATRCFIEQPLELTSTKTQYDITAIVKGGGPTGQAGAVRHAVSRALAASDHAHREVLKDAGCLTRDPRMKERKKPGQPGARKRFQFSKR
ncbi:MAG: small subunit ribosomal protein S9 [Candidatus Promineifilaceae bacterium]|jgi:small subunit ribosomal protein S9